MADFDTLTDLLMAQPERKLVKLREGTLAEIQRLGLELRLVEAALNRKRNRRDEVVTKPSTNGASSGTKDGLPRAELLRHVIAMDKPTFRPPDVRDYLGKQGIVRTVEATRNGLVRLERDGSLTRTQDGSFAVSDAVRDTQERFETETPGLGSLSLESPGTRPGT